MDKIFGEVDAVAVGEQEAIEMDIGEEEKEIRGKGVRNIGNSHVEVHTA